jgi:hypothetical protein
MNTIKFPESKSKATFSGARYLTHEKIFSLKIGHREKLVALALTSRMEPDGSNLCQLVKTLAEKTGYSKRAVSAALGKLVNLGLIATDAPRTAVVVKKKNGTTRQISRLSGGRKATTYRLAGELAAALNVPTRCAESAYQEGTDCSRNSSSNSSLIEKHKTKKEADENDDWIQIIEQEEFVDYRHLKDDKDWTDAEWQAFADECVPETVQ